MTSAKATDNPTITEKDIYHTLIRSLRRRKGFGVIFVQCSPAEADSLVLRIIDDLTQKKIGVLQLTEPIENLYQLVASYNNRDKLDILLIQGLEKSLEADIRPGYGGEGGFYNLNTFPRILNHFKSATRKLSRSLQQYLFCIFSTAFCRQIFYSSCIRLF